MEKRKDTRVQGAKLPSEYLTMVENLFNKNFSKSLLKEGKNKESFKVRGEIFPDEVLLAISLKHTSGIRMITCYASIDVPLNKHKDDPKNKSRSVADTVQDAVNLCVDGIASYFSTYFEEGRPIDRDSDYNPSWDSFEIEKNQNLFLKVTNDNLDLEEQADAILRAADEDENKATSQKKKNTLH